MTLLLISNVLCWIGFYHSYGMLGWDGFYSLCFTFREYFEYPFGVHLFIFVLCYRLLIIYRLLILHRKSSAWYKATVVLVVYVPILGGYVYFDVSDTASTFSSTLGCVPTPRWSIYSFAIVLVGIIALIFLNYSLRNTPDNLAAFHEYKDSKKGSVALILAYAVTGAVYFTGNNHVFWGRVVILLVVGLIFNFYFCVVLFRPVYGCIFMRDEALAKFYHRIGRSVKSSATTTTGGGVSTGVMKYSSTIANEYGNEYGYGNAQQQQNNGFTMDSSSPPPAAAYNYRGWNNA